MALFVTLSTVISFATGSFTVTSMESDVPLRVVAVMLTVPALIPVTTPAPSTVAMVVSEDVKSTLRIYASAGVHVKLSAFVFPTVTSGDSSAKAILSHSSYSYTCKSSRYHTLSVNL